ncbi:hypothetical protein CORC01_12723, partial [Colletotrichum orchidophilum]
SAIGSRLSLQPAQAVGVAPVGTNSTSTAHADPRQKDLFSSPLDKVPEMLCSNLVDIRNSSLGIPMRHWAAPEPLPSPPILGYPCPLPYFSHVSKRAGCCMAFLWYWRQKTDSSQVLGRSPPSPWVTDAAFHYPTTIGEPSDCCFNMIGFFLRARNSES